MKSFATLIVLLSVQINQANAQTPDFASVDFSKADSVAKLHSAFPLNNIRGLVHNLTASLPTEQEKFRAIFQWVCNNIEVDYDLVMMNKRKANSLSGTTGERWNKKFNALVFDKLLKEKKTICTGYAYLIRELAFHAGLSCEIINGHAKPGGITGASNNINHSWNRIQINGKWYFSDATWASGVFNRATGTFIKRYRNEYFLSDEGFFRQEHRF